LSAVRDLSISCSDSLLAWGNFVHMVGNTTRAPHFTAAATRQPDLTSSDSSLEKSQERILISPAVVSSAHWGLPWHKVHKPLSTTWNWN
jgi:hypothetical protein